MEFFKMIPSLLCGFSPFVFGWIIFSLIVGIRIGWEASVRLLLLGLSLLGSLLAIFAIFFFLPDWISIILMFVGAFFPWIVTLHYFAMTKFSGRLLMAIPSKTKSEKWSVSIVSGTFLVILGLSRFISHDALLTPAKSYALGAGLVSLGIFRAIQRIRYTQIREKGILYEFGSFYKWKSIEDYTWKFGEDKLSLNLKYFSFKRKVNLKIPSQFRQEVVTHLSQNISITNFSSPQIP